MSYDYGNCHACEGKVAEKLVDQMVQEAEDWILIRSVSTGVCTQCGEKILRSQVIVQLEQILNDRDGRAPDQCIQVPVFAFG